MSRKPLSLLALAALAAGLPIAPAAATACKTPASAASEWRRLDTVLRRHGYSDTQRRWLLGAARQELAGVVSAWQRAGASPCTPEQNTARIVACTRTSLPAALAREKEGLDGARRVPPDQPMGPGWQKPHYTVRELLFIDTYADCLSAAMKALPAG